MMSSHLMCSARIWATDPLFQAACKVDLKSALKHWGLDLTQSEIEAFRRIFEQVDGQEVTSITMPKVVWL
jgi:hypothetical protein